MSDMNDKTPRSLLVIKASAGSGKTYTLAKQYIQHLLFTTADDGSGRLLPRRGEQDTRLLNTHRQLLAITFTNKATDEMKERIVNELYHLATPGKKSDYLATFMKRSGLTENRVRAMARHALDELLFDYSNFNVSTIDSFFQTILRNFARELDRDYNYDIQLDDKYAVKVAVHKFMLSLGRMGKPTQVDLWVKEYQRHLLRSTSDKKKWKFFEDGGDLYDLAKDISTELFRKSMDEVKNYLGKVDDTGVFRSDFSRIRAFSKQVHDIVERLENKQADLLAQLRSMLQPFDGVLSGSRSFAPWMAKGGTQPLSTSLQNADEEYIASQFKKTGRPDDDTIASLTRIVNDYFADTNVKDFLSYIENHLGLLGLLAMIDQYLAEFRRETNSILLSDTNELIGTVLDSGSEFVYERVGSVIAHFMIDEFQDTSTKQYENFRGLIRESLANGDFNMLIGDAKQSIYRFRNADPTVFRERVDRDFSRDITHREDESDGTEQQGGPSSINYRSSRHIIEFNNDFFEEVMQDFGDQPVVAMTYQDVEQGFSPGIDEKRVPGFVRVHTGNYRGLLDDELINSAAAAAGVPVDADGDVPVLAVLPGYLLKLHERYDWGRMGILVNSHRQGDKIVETILNYNQHTTGEPISIISGESLLLVNSPVIRRIISMLRFIDISQFSHGEDEDNEDAEDSLGEDNDAARMMRSMQRKRLSEQRLYSGLDQFIQAVSAGEEASPTDIGGTLARVFDTNSGGDEQQFADTLARLLPAPGELTTLVSIVESIIANFRRDPAQAADVDREVAFLLAFQDTVMQFSAQRNGGSVREFLKFWDEKKGSLAVSSSSTGDAINIMTIHKAKGLEFDCVIIPYANWQINFNSMEKEYWMPRGAMADALNAVCPCDGGWDLDVIPPLTSVSKSTVEALAGNHMLQGEASAFVAKQQADVLIDNLNKTYVAFTRPRTELHIFCRVDKVPKNEKANDSDKITLTHLMTRYAQEKMTPVMRGDSPTSWYEHGTISTRSEIDAKRSVEQSDAIRCSISRYAVADIPSDLTVKIEKASNARAKSGIRLHSILSRIGDRNDVDRVINQGLKHGIITTDPDDSCGIDNVNKNVRQPIMDDNCRVSAWFDPANKVYTERTITTVSQTEGSVIKNHRPDRIIKRPDGTILVIDYKSGRRNDKENLPQMQEYINHLHAIFPGTPIAGRLWYTTLHLILDENGHPLSNNAVN